MGTRHVSALGFNIKKGELRHCVLSGTRREPVYASHGRGRSDPNQSRTALANYFKQTFGEVIFRTTPDRLAYRVSLDAKSADQVAYLTFPFDILSLVANDRSLPISEYVSQSFSKKALGFSGTKFKACDEMTAGSPDKRIGIRPYLPRALKTILRRACDQNPTRRYASAAAFREALERLSLTRRWVRVSDNEWTCESTRRVESVPYVNGHRPMVEFFNGSRRQLELCGTFRTECEAREHMDQVIAETTIGRAAPAQRPRANRTGIRETGNHAAATDDLT